MTFKDRLEAGRLLAERLEDWRGREGLLVLGIPRGGVVVAHEIANNLQAPLDLYITRKIGAPQNPELAIGAVASDGTRVVDETLLQTLGVSESYLEEESERQREEIARRMEAYRGDSKAPGLKGRPVILVDDGIATGATTGATIEALRKAGPSELVLAVPVGPRETLERLEPKVDTLICLHRPRTFWAVGSFYLNFE
ncbi:MAG: phosphoribosyltransferase, partial [Anaerolineae bacterium]